MKNKIIIAMHNNTNFIKTLKSYLVSTFAIIERQQVQSILQEIRINPVDCIVFHIEEKNEEYTQFGKIKKSFSHIPCIAVIDPLCIELARYCGSIGIEYVLPLEKMYSIKDEIARVCAEKNNKVYIGELSIDKNDPFYSKMIKESLLIIERDYLQISSINEIANLLETNESTLCREFNKYRLLSPKKILVHLKVHHAIKLMHNEGLNVREISSLSGFPDNKRMAECFHRMFGMPPGEYRAKHIDNTIFTQFE